jgi:hypothetical protein
LQNQYQTSSWTLRGLKIWKFYNYESRLFHNLMLMRVCSCETAVSTARSTVTPFFFFSITIDTKSNLFHYKLCKIGFKIVSIVTKSQEVCISAFRHLYMILKFHWRLWRLILSLIPTIRKRNMKYNEVDEEKNESNV